MALTSVLDLDRLLLEGGNKLLEEGGCSVLLESSEYNMLSPGSETRFDRYSGNFLYTKRFKSSQDIDISFLYTNPNNIREGDILLEDGSYLLLEDDGHIVIDYSNLFSGLAVFLVDADPFKNNTFIPLLTGGGLGTSKTTSVFDGPPLNANGTSPGIGMVTDTNTTSLSAISGLLVMAALDGQGYFGYPDTIEQFKDGACFPTINHIVGRVAENSSLTNTPSSFKFCGAQLPSKETIIDEKYKLFRLSFKRNLQDIVFYRREGNAYIQDIKIETDFNFDSIPQFVRLGISYVGGFPLQIKNITIEGDNS